MKAYKTPLRFAIMLNSNYLKRWQVDALHLLVQSGLAQPVLMIMYDGEICEDGANVKHSPSFISRIFYRLILRCQALEDLPLPQMLTHLPVKRCRVKRHRFSQYFLNEDVQEIKDFNLDFILRFGFSIIRGDILYVARYGIWSYHHADERVIRGGPIGFWELYLKHSMQGVILQKLTNHLDGGVILKKRFYRMIRHNYRLHVNTILMDCVDMPVQVCRDIINETAHYFDDKPSASIAPVYTYPSIFQLCFFFLQRLTDRMHLYYQKLFKFERWSIAVSKTGVPQLITTGTVGNIKFVMQHAHSHCYFADPFILKKENHTLCLIFEYYDYTKHKANLATAEIHLQEDKQYSVNSLNVLTDSNVHRSFPCVWSDGEKVYVIPEQISLHRVDMYEWHATEGRLTLKYQLLDIPLVDPAFFYYNGYYWLMGSPAGYHSNDKLYIFYSTNIEGPYEAHHQNPVVVDARRARMAGQVIQHEEHFIRPAQDCHQEYGKAISLFCITKLSPAEYEEEYMMTIHIPKHHAFASGFHTIHLYDDICVFDGKSYVFSFRLLFNELLRKIGFRTT